MSLLMRITRPEKVANSWSTTLKSYRRQSSNNSLSTIAEL